MINTERTVFLTCGVDMGIGKEVIKRLEALEQESQEPILLVISTYGGCCRTMLAVRDAMKRNRCVINVLAIGKAMSAGCYLLVAGAATGKRAITRDCQMMIHGPNGGAELTEKGLGNMRYYYEIVYDHFAEDAGFTKEEMDKYLDRDFYCMGDKAVELGFADYVI
ncbi:ATP-dependent Clp proteolytic subunit [Vibrio phage vB_pir03]|nr:ATP-dependent Clp proteolytic subunit [Vibrio phage vB_pir03]